MDGTQLFFFFQFPQSLITPWWTWGRNNLEPLILRISSDVSYHIIQKYAAFAQVTFLCNVQQYHGSHMNIF